MRFRLQLTVAGLSLDSTGVDPLTLWLRRAHEISVVLAREQDEDSGVRLSCVVETEFEPSDRIRQAFESLAANRLPAGHLPRDDWEKDHDYIDTDGNILDNYIVPLYLMPESFQDFARQLSDELSGATDTAVGLLRWRSRTFGPRQPFSTRGLEWAFTSGEWDHMPSALRARLGEAAHVHVTGPAAAELQDLLDRGEQEPLAHELLREAWSERHENPRSSLLIGITSLEVGIKHYISVCVPAAAWLAEEAPTPPLDRIMRDYLPTLNTPSGGPPLDEFDSGLLSLLKKAAFERNRLTHAGVEIAADRVESILLGVRDVLWTLDVALGHPWADEYRRASLDDRPDLGWRRI